MAKPNDRLPNFSSSLWKTTFLDKLNAIKFWRRKDNNEIRHITPNPSEGCSRYKLSNYIQYNNNEISTTKYNPITFIPRNLFEQFHRLANVYFIFILGVDCFPLFNATPIYINALPVVFILLVTGLKDAWEDLRRRKLDSKVNNTKCLVFDKKTKTLSKMAWKHILVGDIVHISNNEFIPADIMVLRCSNSDGNVFVETSNLDGESNLKHKTVPNIFSQLCGNEATSVDYSCLPLKIACAKPSRDINNMHGSVEFDGRYESFTPANTLLRGCRLRNTTFVEGIVLYAGNDTKMMLSAGRAPYKRSHIEMKTNMFIIACALLLATIVGITTIFRVIWIGEYPDPFNRSPVFALLPAPLSTNSTNPPDWLASIGCSIVIYQIMVPLALYITIEFVKIGQVFFMQQDIFMYSVDKDEAFIARSLSLNEELGQLTHLLSDKTGTLTQNKMVLKRCATVDGEYTTQIDISRDDFTDAHDPNFRHLLKAMIACNTVFVQSGKQTNATDDQDESSREYCHNDSSSSDLSDTDEVIDDILLQSLVDFHYEGESADELALVKGARHFGYELTSRSNKSVSFARPDGKESKLDILCSLPFDTIRKRMSVCVVGDRKDEVIVYSKGADSSMLGMGDRRVKRISGSCSIDEEDEDGDGWPLKKSSDEIIRSRVDEYSRMGLRTLVFGMRVLRRSEFNEWLRLKAKVESTHVSDDCERARRELAERIEMPTRVIGVTAVEDRLQDGVAKSIESLKEAGIQVWILTGDKKETAEGVTTACGLFKDLPEDFDLGSDQQYAGKDVVISPDQVTEIGLPTAGHFDRLEGASSVLCYRLTPGQKAEIVKAVKRRGGIVAAIGDGANDVPMIQAAHVGIGASMAADFVIAQFSFVSRLVLMHGHWNFARIANVMFYFFYKNMQNVMLTFFIQVSNGWSCGFPINITYSVLYPAFFTSVQPIICGVMDQDRSEKELMADSSFYKANGNLYDMKHFLLNVIDAVWQAAVCYAIAHIYCLDSSHTAQYMGFCLASVMFTSNMAHLILDTRSFNIVMFTIHVAGIIFTFGFFLIFDLLPGDELWVSHDAMSDCYYYCVVLLVTIIAITPRLLVRVSVNFCSVIEQISMDTFENSQLANTQVSETKSL